jgi:MFS family permease
MSRRQTKTGIYAVEGLNSFATVYYLYYLYFFTQKSFGFGTKANFALAALNGAFCVIGSLLGGKFAQQRGYYKALKTGLIIMTLALAIGSQLATAFGHICAMCAMVTGMCFTWPSLEALISENESAERLPRMVGIYNVVWAGAGAVAYFVGGALLDKLGSRSIFYIPATIELALVVFVFWLEKQSREGNREQRSEVRDQESGARAAALREPAQRKNYLHMAWLANPFAYIAINSLVATIPSLAIRLGLSATLAGFYCSMWCFARVAAFLVLWFWPGWHYRFRWLLAAYLAMSATFAAILFAHSIFMLITAQIIFGGALGLIYYSSLFYSMDSSDSQGEHGGIHEAAISFGNFAGPAIGAASLHFLPQHANGGIWAVSGLLVAGLAGLLVIWRNGKTNGAADS